MRRTHAARIPTSRRQLAFEPLEPRELLAADTGFDWSSSWDAPTSEDWSWTFDDASSFDTGDEAWWDDSWWVDDVSWDAPDAEEIDFGAVDYGGNDWTGFDAGGYDWFADVGGADAGWTEDVVTPPAPDDAGGATDEPVATVVDVVIPPSPRPLPGVVDVSPDVEPPPPVIVVSADGDATADEDVGFAWDLATGGGESATDATPEVDVDADEPEPTDVVDVTIVDVPVDGHDDTWMYTTFDDASSAEGLPPDPTADSGGDAVVEVVADDLGEPTVLLVTPVASGPVRSADVPMVAIPSAATGVDGSRFAAWAAGFMQAFWRPAGDVDGPLAGGLANGQIGTGRPRVRLPFRPIV